MKQAEGASKAAQNLMDKKGDAKDAKGQSEKEELLKKLNTAEVDRDTMKAQAENLQEEYDRVCEQLRKVC